MTVNSEKIKKTDIIKGLVIVGAFLIGHLYFSPMLYLAALATVGLYVLDYQNVVAWTMFFIPLARIMKFSPEGMTVLGIATLLALCVMLLHNKMRFGIGEVVLGLLFFVLLLVKNIMGAFGFPFSYLRIILLLVLLPQCLECGKKGELHFHLERTANMAFAGICTASLIGMIWADHSQLSSYIATEDIYHVGESVVNRLCGLSSDPNYFSSLILFAAALQFICLIYTRQPVYIVGAVILSAIGVLTLSKMFLLLIALIWCVGILGILKDRSISMTDYLKKYRILFLVLMGLVVFGVCFVCSGYFSIILSRFGHSGASSITTGRSDIWRAYINEIVGSLRILFLGAASNAQTVGAHVTHNTFIQIWWKIGTLGSGIVLAWFIILSNRTKKAIRYPSVALKRQTTLLFLAQLLPLLALDKFFFDEFYWYYMVYLLSRIYLSEQDFCVGGTVHE